ncbi:MAG: tyrosine-type recombinase/integrase, partial [Planctomycetota bacterium]
MASLIRRKYKVKDKNGKTVVKQSPYWYIDYKTAEGTRKRIKGFKDKGATAQLAARLEKDSELAQAGVIDKYAEHRKRSLVEHLDDFKANLLGKGNTAQHAQITCNRIKAILDDCRFTFMADISASKALRYLTGRRRDGLSVKSSNDYLQAVKQFCRWMVTDRRMPDNPLAYLSGLNVKTDRRHDRRALSTKEIEGLIKAALEGKKHHKMTSKERVMLYMLALNTGLRANEIASLTWQSFKLGSPAPTVTVLAAFSKHRRDDILPVRGDLAEQFRKWKAERNESSEDKVFPNFNKRKGAEMLKVDLEVAGIPYKDEAGRYADLHSLRHTFVSSLSQSGVSPKVAQSLARHSTISLTMDTYTHIGLYDERAALEKLPELPDMGGNEDIGNKAAACKTGTDDLPVDQTK